MKKAILLLTIYLSVLTFLDGQKNVRTFIFGNSLINHEFQTIPTLNEETSVPYWFQELAESEGYTYAVGGQYGFLPQHANLPPISQWGFSNVEGAWESDYEPFSEADFTNVLITPGNFIQFQSPSENYPYENVSPLSSTVEIFDWCIEQEPLLNFYIYENWPDMAGFLSNGFPPNETEWQSYNTCLNGEFHDWFVEYYDLVRSSFPNSCVRIIPVGTAISKLLQQAPFNQIPITELYEDDAPHGRATTYFLASIITYMAMYEEAPSASYQVEDIIHPIIRNNYADVVDIMWSYLRSYNNENGISDVFCNAPIMTSIETDIYKAEVELIPNPVSDILQVKGNISIFRIEILGIDGKRYFMDNCKDSKSCSLDINNLPHGLYVMNVFDSGSQLMSSHKFIKL